MNGLPRPPKPRRAPKLFKHPRSGYYYALFYDRTRQPARKWYALETDQKRRAMRLFQQADDAWFAGTLDPWRATSQATGKLIDGTLSLDKAVEIYVDAKLRAGVWRPSTEPNRRRQLKRFAASLSPGIGPSHVTEADVRRFLGEPPRRKRRIPDQGGAVATSRTSQTTRAYLTGLVGFFAWCIEEGLAEHNPAAGIPLPRAPRPSVDHLEPEQFDELLRAVRRDHSYHLTRSKKGLPVRAILWASDVFELAVYTGLRLGELARLRWCDVALAAQAGPTLYVRNVPPSKYGPGGQTKSGLERSLPLVPPAVALLERLAAARPNEDDTAPVFLAAGRSAGEVPPMRAIRPGVMSQAFKRYAAAAKLPERLTFHCLRKTCGTWLLNRGVELPVVQRVLGHGTMALTESTYTNVWDRTIRRQIEAAFQSERPALQPESPATAPQA